MLKINSVSQSQSYFRQVLTSFIQRKGWYVLQFNVNYACIMLKLLNEHYISCKLNFRIILNHKLLKQFLFISIDNLNDYFHTVHSY